MGKENHVFAPAYKDADIKELGEICDHIIFNSFAQLRRHKDAVSGKSLGLRINPECSTQGIMLFMIPVLLVQDLALQKRYLTVRLQQSRSF